VSSTNRSRRCRCPRRPGGFAQGVVQLESSATSYCALRRHSRAGEAEAGVQGEGHGNGGEFESYSDGAAALVLMSSERAKALGIKPLARFITFAAAGVEPDVMGIGAIKAVPKAFKRAKMSMKDVDLIEFNEAFAAQVVAVVRELKMPEDKVNVNGGAIALRSPVRRTGSKLTTQLVHELGPRGGGVGW